MAATPAWRRSRSAGRRPSRTARSLTALAYAKSPVVKAPMVAPAPSADIVFWAQGFGAWGRFDGDGNAASVRRDLAGFITGVDTRVGANGRAGIAAGYTGSRNRARRPRQRECRDRTCRGLWRLELRRAQPARRRRLRVPRDRHRPHHRVPRLLRSRDRAIMTAAPGRCSANSATASRSAMSRSSRSPAAPGCGSTPTRRPSAAGRRHSTSPANSFEIGYSTLGIRAASLMPIGDGMVLIPRAAAAWQHAFDSVTPAAALAFQPHRRAVRDCRRADRARRLLAEAGLDLAIGRNATLGVSYVGQIARNVRIMPPRASSAGGSEFK